MKEDELVMYIMTVDLKLVKGHTLNRHKKQLEDDLSYFSVDNLTIQNSLSKLNSIYQPLEYHEGKYNIIGEVIPNIIDMNEYINPGFIRYTLQFNNQKELDQFNMRIKIKK